MRILFCTARPFASTRVPLLTTVAPVKVFAPLKVVVPEPESVSTLWPLLLSAITEEIFSAPLSMMTSSWPPPLSMVPPVMAAGSAVVASGVTRMPPVLTVFTPARVNVSEAALKRRVLTVTPETLSPFCTSTLLAAV